MKSVSTPILLLVWLFTTALHAETRYVEGDVIVTFKATASLNEARDMLKKRSLSFARHFDRLSEKRKKHTGLVQDKSQTTAQMIKDLKDDPTVESVEPNYIRWVKSTPNDVRFNELWALRNTGQSVDGVTGTSGADISYDEAWQYARQTGARPVVAVIDTGVDYTHADLAANLWRNATETAGNQVDDDGNGYVDDVVGYDFASGDSDPFDSGEHGTHVAGTIAALGNNSMGVVGVMDRAQIVALKVSTDGSSITTSSVIAALQYATALKSSGVNLVAINASYGGGGFSTSESAAIQAAGSAGILFVAAAGNESANNDAEDTYPASYRLSNMIVVAASDQNDQLASYSNYGATTVDIAAPGTNILSLEPGTVSFQSGGTTYASNEITYAGRTTGLSGALVACGIGNTSEFPSTVSGNIALIQRGTLTFAAKIANAKAAGAVAAIIYNNAAGNFLGTVSAPGDWIPARSISQADGAALKAALPRTGAIVVSSPYQVLDGTSMATPHVAGAVAFAAMCFPSESVSARRQRILNAVDKKASLASKVITGGRLNLMSVINGGVAGYLPWPYLTTADTLPAGAVGAEYNTALSASGGSAPYHFTLQSGSLPAGLSLANSGVISGTPTTAGTSSFTVQVGDGNGVGLSHSFSLEIAAAPPVIVTAADLADATVGQDYGLRLEAASGTAPYAWSLAAGELPQGLVLTSSGTLGGVPTATGEHGFQIRLTDAKGITVTQTFSLTVIPSSITSSTPAVLDGGVTGVAYSRALTASGGTGPYVWSLVGGGLPSGLTLQSDGILAGTPSAAGAYTFDLRMMDAAGSVGAQRFFLTVTSTYIKPVMEAGVFPAATIGANYSAPLSAQNYPTAFIANGLPSGLACSKSTGLISGRPRVSGTFTVSLRASNSAGSSATVVTTLTVLPIAAGRIGSFAGLIARDPLLNDELGARLTLTTTSVGSFTVKITIGQTSKAATGYLLVSSPHVQVIVGGALLVLDLDAESHRLTGTHGTATVTGWRSTWDSKTLPATTRSGYYSAGIDLADTADDGQEAIPQGSGYISGTLALNGTCVFAGRTADGQAVSQTSPLGPGGEVLMYQSLHNGKGSLTGVLQITEDTTAAPAENSISGSLTWLRPAVAGRNYPAGFGPLNLTAQGRYLGILASTRLIVGLPSTGPAALTFTDGGLSSAALDPDISITYSSTNTITVPTYASGGNPANVTLAINKNTGAVSGTFTLVETSPALTRKVTYQGLIVRTVGGTQKAVGYFLLPQFPASGQTISTSPILSGGMQISQ